MATLARWQATIQDEAGNILPGAFVEVRRDVVGGNLAPLFSDRAGTVGLGNPAQADEEGFIAFHVQGGPYRIRAYTGSSLAPTFERIWRYAGIGTASEADLDTLYGRGLVIQSTFENLEGITPVEETDGGWVLDDPDPLKNGYYSREGSVWVWQRGFPDTMARLTVGGGGTENAVQAGVEPGVNPSNVEVFYVDITTPNTGNVTMSINEGAALPVYDISGNQFAPGVFAGRLMLSNEGTSLRSLTDANAAVTSAANAAAAANSAVEAELYKDQAEAAAALSGPTGVYTGYWAGNGIQTVFTMSQQPTSTSHVFVFWTGVEQNPDTYTIDGYNLTFIGGAPPAPTVGEPANNLSYRIVAIADGTAVPPDGSVTATRMDNSAIPTKLHAAADKVTPADDDEFGGTDSAAAFGLVRFKWSNIKAALVTYLSSMLVPTGQIAFHDRSTAPAGWVKTGITIGNAASGAGRANADTLALFTLIWTEFNNTDRPILTSAGGASTRGASAAADYAANKRLPVADPRGRVLRALDDSKGIDTGRLLGTVQGHAVESHTHTGGIAAGTGAGANGGSWVSGFANTGGMATGTSASETRMTNYAALCCIKL